MANQHKKTAINLRKYYTVFLEIGIVTALLIFIVAMKADLTREKATVDFSHEKEIVTIQKIPRTVMENQPPPPVDPVVPAKEPVDDPIINDPIDNIDLNVIDNSPIDVPPTIIKKPDEEIFVVVEQNPAAQNDVNDFLKYPRKCKNAGTQGRVFLEFVVNLDGSVQDVEVLRGIGSGCDEAAVAAIKKVKWTPGRQRGEPVRVRFSRSILFRLNN